MPQLVFDPDTHTYRLGGARLPSVTQVIAETLGTGWKASDWHLQRGRAVHACAALIATGQEFEADPQIAGQVEALRRWFAEIQPTVLGVEQPMFSQMYRFAGTPDLLARIGNGPPLLIDFKASVDADRLPLQLGGYAVLAEGFRGLRIRIGHGVEIREDGTYSMTPAIKLAQYTHEFLALRSCYAIRERLGLIETGGTQI